MRAALIQITFTTAISVLLLSSCAENADPAQSVSHPADWLTAGAEEFHGTKVLASGAETCKSCHGESYAGGESGVACAECHANFPHSDQWAVPDHPESHGIYIASANWDFEGCTSCHGLDYLGGSSGESCYECHTQTGGPEACNTCHGSSAGDVSELATWAPPEDLSGNIAATFVGVGAHQVHLNDTTWTTAYTQDCGLCHDEPVSFSDPMHIDDSPGRNMLFGDAATDSGSVTPQWDGASESCQNVYCHGNFEFRRDESSNQFAYADSLITGNNPQMIWTLLQSGQADCGTCHGLPPTGHGPFANCSACHGSVVDSDNNIIDRSKHINGAINVFE